MKTNRWARAGAPRVVGGAIVAAALSACTKGPPDCRADQYWSEPIRTCVGLRQWMESNDGAFPDGYVAPEASLEAGMDATVEAATPSCDGGQRACGASCSDLATDPLNCGACGAACPTAANASAACVAGRCDVRCDMGAHRCGASCLRDDDTASCGSRCTPCPEPLGARPTCATGMCGYECLGGYDDTGSACEMRVARPLFPWGLSTVTMLRPTLRWELPMGVEGAQVELCRDRACTTVIERVNAVGTSARPSADLPASTVVFWRLRGRIGAVNSARTSATWQFRTPARSATTADTAHGVELDVNGDGYSDVAIGSTEGVNARIDVFLGGAGGLAATASTTLRPIVEGARVLTDISSAGDLDGDGFGELILGFSEASPAAISAAGTVLIYRGSATGLDPTVALALNGENSADRAGARLVGVGDSDGDGYADFVEAAPTATVGGVEATGRARLVFGRALLRSPRTRTFVGTPSSGFGVSCTAGDVNGDTLADLLCASQFAAPNGAISLFLGALGGALVTPTTTWAAPVGNPMGGWLRLACGDFTGDGHADLVIGLANATASGRFNAGMLSLHVAATGRIPAAPSRTIEVSESVQLGAIVRFAGDLNGDGFGDLLATARTSAGVVHALHGTANGPVAPAARTLAAVGASDRFASDIAAVGDVTRDGFADVLIGAPGSTVRGANNVGEAHLHGGAAMGLGASSAQTFEGSAMNVFFGELIAR